MKTLDKKKLKAQAHALKPVIMIGQSGLTPAVLAEIENALDFHELIKVKIRSEREERKLISEKISLATNSSLIQRIGQITVFYRSNPSK